MAEDMQARINSAVEAVGRVLLGKESRVRLALACLFAQGHLLIEDLPGVGKTTLAHALARVLGLSFSRIQFTSDLLPADVLGVNIFEKATGEFRFHPGPIFNQLVLADEINRTTPKSQSALLEAMEERQVTVEGKTRALPWPFFVIATQNPATQAGTFPLPESQLDRFLMRIDIGYPDSAAERLLLEGEDRREVLKQIEPCLSQGDLAEIQRLVRQVYASDSLLNYVQRLISYTRDRPEFAFGLSPRAGLALLNCAKSWALIHDRNHVLPEDVKDVLPSVVVHRLRESNDYSGHSGSALAQRLLTEVDPVDA